ncbi:MAG: hypothetical protein GX230_01860 [Lentisphaerae bacterium]|nr:hypothetical protein [Lentisphaerota bacterium]
MADNTQNLDNDQTRIPEPPPKDTPFIKPAENSDPRRSSRITPPAEAFETPAPVTADEGAPTIKRRTSRVPLPDGVKPAGVTEASGSVPKTIRVIRPPSASGAAMPQPGANPLPPGPKGPTPQMSQAAKSKTSRISLESAIGGAATQAPVADGVVEGAPKTIRLKRPSEMPTLKVPAIQSPGGATARTTGSVVPPRASGQIAPPAPGPSKTARIIGAEGTPPPTSMPVPEAASTDSVPLTQKRTIRVKRPGAPSITVPKSDDAATTDDDTPALTPLSPEEAMGSHASDSCNPVFWIAAVASIVVTGVMILIMYQQLFGPTALY